ncbi:TonB-dependent receptor, partial [Oleiphilus sp. HI0086]
LSGRKQFKRFELVGSSSYVRSENKELNSDYLAFPQWIFTLQGNYLLADSNIELSIKQRAMLNYSEGDYITSTNPTTLEVTQIAPEDADDYFRTDLSLLKHFDSKSGEGERAMYINVNNIFDQKNTVASLYNVENGLADSGLSV